MRFWTLGLLAWALAGAVHAASCAGYPYVLTNGQLADATQVMADFNTVRNCVVNNAAPTPVPLTSIAGIATGTLLGNNTGSTGSPIALTPSQALTLLGVPGAYAPLVSPTFTGIPAAPTATTGDNTTQIATDAFVNASVTANAPATATTSVQGVTTLATGSQVVTGTDTTHAVTPAALTSSQSLNTTGYYTFPGGGIIEWGNSGNVSSGSSLAITFPKACVSVNPTTVITPQGGGGSSSTGYAYVTSVSLTGFTIYNNANLMLTFNWQAICK